ncbi:MAG: fused MFS/spermidine synthase [Opitutae bacterium]|nr:fused MFS/spermidine synthase [Opitutae bacterium]
MKRLLSLCLTAVAVGAAEPDYVQNFDSLYNNLTVEKRGTVVELRARAHGGEALESAVDLSDPQQLVVRYTRTLYSALFFQPRPERVLMVGLGGAGFHRLFAASYPQTLLQTAELDPKVFELCQSHLGFRPTAQTPVTIQDGRLFVKRSKEKWDWLILDAFRGGYVPPHLKTEEFYRECAARLSERGVFISNLHAGNELYYSDIKTICAVFPQVVLFSTAGTGNVIACAVNYTEPSILDAKQWAKDEEFLRPPMQGRLDFATLRRERVPHPSAAEMKQAKVLSDDFAPVEFLNAMKVNNTR